MNNCVLSNQQQLIIHRVKDMQIGITTRQFGDCRITNNEHNPRIIRLMKMFQTDECVRMVPNHTPKIQLSLALEGGAIKTAKCDGIIHFKELQRREFVSLIHCGWITVADGIVEKAVKNILLWRPVASSDIKAVIYGGICRDCYEVEFDVIEQFQEHADCFITGAESGKYQLNLSKIILQKLLRKGLARENIRNIDICSHHHCFKHINASYRYVWNDGSLLFSHRRGEVERNLVLAKLKNDNTLIAGTTGNCPYVILYNA